MLENKFPILKRKLHGRRLVYLDNAATTQKPLPVLTAMEDYYCRHNANVHRSIHTLSQEATALYEGAREKMRQFLNAEHREEIIFTKGATESINLVARSFGESELRAGEEILVSEAEHHSNLVPWQELAKRKKLRLKYIPVDKAGKLAEKNLRPLLTRQTKLLALAHASNFFGTVNPVKKIIGLAHRRGIRVLLDGAQAGGHLPLDVRQLDADFYALSGHKMYGPTGIGVLYAKRELLEAMPPYQTGGEMIEEVTWQNSTWNELPWKFEAGTPNIAGAVGLGAAADFLQKIGLREILAHERALTAYALRKLRAIPRLRLFGPLEPKQRLGILSFVIPGLPAHDLATLLDRAGIAVRTGHHCTMPMHRKLGLDASVRVSLGLYNRRADIDALIEGIKHARRLFGI